MNPAHHNPAPDRGQKADAGINQARLPAHHRPDHADDDRVQQGRNHHERHDRPDGDSGMKQPQRQGNGRAGAERRDAAERRRHDVAVPPGEIPAEFLLRDVLQNQRDHRTDRQKEQYQLKKDETEISERINQRVHSQKLP